MFYFKLATSSLKKNKRAYAPFIFSMVFLVMINVIMQVLVNNKGMNTLPSAMAAKSIFHFGSVIIMIFTGIFSLYTNSFLLKQRKKELGLYNILGLGKRELAHVLFFEFLLSMLLSIFLGVVSGVIFSKLSFLILKKMSNFGSDFVYSLDIRTLMMVVGLFVLIFIVLFIINVIQLSRVNPLELLAGSQHGEKEPKAKWLSGLIGIVSIVIGYTISLSIKSPLEAISQFFIAVLLVIVGTYGVFTASSIAILKLLKRNQRFYYQPNHFISVSSMMYRMKQNAVGLASICVLSTMVLVTVSTTASLYFGMDNVTKNRNPYDVSVQVSTENKKDVLAIYQDVAKEQQVMIDEINSVDMSGGMMVLEKESGYEALPVEPGQFNAKEMSQSVVLNFMTLEEFNRLSKKTYQLKNNQGIIYSMANPYAEKNITLGQQTIEIKESVDELSFIPKVEGLTNVYVLILPTEKDINQVIDGLYSDKEKNQEYKGVTSTVYANLSADQQQQLAFSKTVKQKVLEVVSSSEFTSAAMDRESSQNYMGGFLFLGIIFGITFTLATGIIIYYKQISEGHQDQHRYDIMQKVGMSHDEVKRTIKSQILMVFFFPIALATLHLSFAFPLMQKLLLLFGLSDWKLFLMACVVVVAFFLIIYFLMFSQTSKVYYRIVERRK